jgi:ADP-ribose pyrophosphatase
MAEVLSSVMRYSGRVFGVAVDRVRLPHGREADMEVVRHAPAVVLLPLPDADHVILIRQYRYPVDRWLWELPAGSIDAGETPEAAAQRECHEEIGLVPATVTPLARFFPTPGYCDEEMHFFLCTALATPPHAAHQDPDEVIEPRVFTLAEARAMVQRGEIADMKTVVGLLLDTRP